MNDDIPMTDMKLRFMQRSWFSFGIFHPKGR